MAIHIIGSTPTEDDSARLLPEPDVRLPEPETAPSGHRLLGSDRLRDLLGRTEPLLRAFAIEQVAAAATAGGIPDLAEAIVARIEDEDPFVFSEALSTAAEARLPGAAAAVEAAFEDARGGRAAALGTALGRLAPERLLEAVQGRRRLDDEAYPSIATALGVVGSEQVFRFFEKALARSAMMTPERRRALFTAILVSGDRKLSNRVLGEAIGDSNAEAPSGASFPSRVAVASLGGLPAGSSRLEQGEALYDRAREVLEEDTIAAIDESGRKALLDALAQRRVGDALRALEPLVHLELASDPEIEEELGSLPRRRQGLLTAIVDRAKDIGRLELSASTVFVAAAAQAATLVVAGAASEATSPAMIGLAKALEVDPAALADEDLAALTARFEDVPPRLMRRVHTLMTTQAFRRASTLRRFVQAVVSAGHGAGLMAAGGESRDEALRRLILDGLALVTEDAESATLEVLEERPLDPATTGFALEVAERLRTERLGLALGHRFFELRKIDKALVARAMLHSGDARLMPLLQARAYPDEPEETAWAILALVHDHPIEGELEAAVERIRKGRAGEPRPPLEVELECQRCGETGAYYFDRAFVDPEAKDDHGDPAFVGDMTCKACQTQDALRATPATGQLLAGHMLRFLEAMQAGEGVGAGLVQPGQTQVEGERMGLAAALRRLDALVEASPDRVQLRLERARMRMVLRRRGLDDDLAAVRATEPDAVEATVLQASQAVRDGQRTLGAQLLVEAHRRLSQAPEPRLYDAASVESLREQVEELLLELVEQGERLEAELDLGPARARRSRRREREEALDARMREQLARGAPDPG